jgi:hypothetical protein
MLFRKKKGKHEKKKQPIKAQTQQYVSGREENTLIETRVEESEMPSDASRDLMRLIGEAIEIWARDYHMENMDKRIILGQALSGMNAMYKTLWDEKKK